jgi:hypothetical protein
MRFKERDSSDPESPAQESLESRFTFKTKRLTDGEGWLAPAQD